jgi:hypothetical protein
LGIGTLDFLGTGVRVNKALCIFQTRIQAEALQDGFRILCGAACLPVATTNKPMTSNVIVPKNNSGLRKVDLTFIRSS